MTHKHLPVAYPALKGVHGHFSSHHPHHPHHPHHHPYAYGYRAWSPAHPARIYRPFGEYSVRPSVGCTFRVMESCDRRFRDEDADDDCREGARDAHLLHAPRAATHPDAYRSGFYGATMCPAQFG